MGGWMVHGDECRDSYPTFLIYCNITTYVLIYAQDSVSLSYGL
jgi:hypothetical protein